MYITEVSIKRPVVAWVMSLILIIFGIFVFSELPVRELPDGIQPPVVQVQTEYKSASAEIVDEEITQKIEDVIGGAEGIKNIDSIQTGELCKEAMIFSKDMISKKGFFISKIFMGGSFNEIVALGKKIFKEVKVFKPKSSRKDSKESFIICRNLR